MEYYQNEILFGLDEKLQELINLCDLVFGDEKHKDALAALSIVPTFLFYGIPGTGKTITAFKLYNELRGKYDNVDCAYLRVEDLLSSNYGESSQNFISFFESIQEEQVKNNSKVVIILDEIDSFGISRNNSENDCTRRILLTFNTIIDKLVREGQFNNKVLIATTNMRESLDSALLRRLYFHEDFNITLDSREFSEYVNLISKAAGLGTIEVDMNKTYELYQKKKYSLGEIKRCFAKYYINKTIDQGNKTMYEIMLQTDSFYELTKCGRSDG